MKSFIFCFTLLFIQCSKCVSNDTKSKLKLQHHVINNIKKDNSSLTEDLPELLGKPEALVRYKHSLPITIIKHKTKHSRRRPKPITRRRVKQPKPKYGPPGYSHGEPLSYYGPSENFYENYESASSPFANSHRFNEYESFYKELGPDFNYDENTFSEYDKQPIKLDLYDKKSYRKISQNKFKKGKFNGRERIKKPSHWTEDESDEEDVYEVPEETPLENIYKPKKPSRKPTKEYKSTIQTQTPWKQHKEIQPEIRIPHTKYGVPFSPEEEFELPHQNSKYHFAEPPEENISYDTHSSAGHITKHSNKKIHSSYSPPTQSYSIDSTYEPPQFVQPPGEKSIQHVYFAEPPKNRPNKYQQETYYPNYKHELPLQIEPIPKYNFPKSSYDVPLYNSVPFRSNEESENNYPPLGGSHFGIPEVQSSPSKKLLRYATTNATLTPPGYFDESPSIDSKQDIYTGSIENLKENSSHPVKNIKHNRTRRRKIKNRSASRISSLQPTVPKQTYEEVYSEQIDHFDNTEKMDKVSSSPFTTNIPLNFLLLSSANRNPGSHISSSQWDPMKVTTYSFKIDHENISASIPNVKVNNKNEGTRSTTTPKYIRRYTARKNRNFKSAEVIDMQTSKSPIIYAGTTMPENINKETEMFSRENLFTSHENARESDEYDNDSPDESGVIVKSDYSISSENINQPAENLSNSQFIRDPFDFIEQTDEVNNQSQPHRYKNHRYF